MLAPTCSYQLRYANASQARFSRRLVLDESEGVLLQNLGFNSLYNVELWAVNSHTPTVLGDSSETTDAVEASAEDKEDSNMVKVGSTSFRTISCADVFGAGSLQCEPEPVRDLNIEVSLPFRIDLEANNFY